MCLCHITKHLHHPFGRSNCDSSTLLEYMLLVLQSYKYDTCNTHAVRTIKLYTRKSQVPLHRYIICQNIWTDCTGRIPQTGRHCKVSAIVDDIGVLVALYLPNVSITNNVNIKSRYSKPRVRPTLYRQRI